MTDVVDAVIIGAGHNGLVAANLLADAGWDVLVVEAADHPGGAVHDAEVTAPGFRTDLFSAFYPMTAASPVMRSLHLEEHGLRWSHAPVVLAHLRPQEPAALLHRDAERTAAGLARNHPEDAAEWLARHALWEQIGPSLVGALLSPMPPVRAGAALAWRARHELLELARLMILPVRRMAEELFVGDAAGLLLAGNALHADITPESPPGALLGWLLVELAQTVGFPVPAGGSGRMVDALVARLHASGGALACGSPVEHVEISGGEATGVQTGGRLVRARRAVLAACDAQILYERLVDPQHLPPRLRRHMRRFQRASSTVKVNWALDQPVPWSDSTAQGAGTVHVADSLDELTITAAELATGRLPAKPFLLIGQMTTADPARSPAGTESLWAYTHVPQAVRGDAAGEISAAGRLDGEALERFVERMEDRIEAHAPGFRDRVIARHVQGPGAMEAANASLIGGDISGGTTQLHQQLVFRPVPGWGRAETPIGRLYLASASAHPGGSVHGASGANAARAALGHDRVRRLRRWLAGGPDQQPAAPSPAPNDRPILERSA